LQRRKKEKKKEKELVLFFFSLVLFIRFPSGLKKGGRRKWIV
jgi:hypothetical protein